MDARYPRGVDELDRVGGYRFAPGFAGIAPRYSSDFTTKKVSSSHPSGQYQISPFAGEPGSQVTEALA